MTAPTTVKDVLLRAADLIEERGWTRGAAERRGRVCALKAVELAATEGGVSLWPAASHLDRLLDEAGRLTVLSWNDGVAKSRQEVVRTLRAAASTAPGGAS